MGNDIERELSEKYCPRFAKIAVDKGYITVDQAKEALAEQMDDDLSNKPHRLIGRILLEKRLLTSLQIEIVLNELLKKAE
ncbi:MAG: hypothetical protein HZB30_00140 [Nitrospirae bacterium]|nr:hypothetical protein [Nitrospirota bacterium]